MSVLFLIPARGGSKGLPRKNLATVGGMPLVARAVTLARQVGATLSESCRIVVSTDDPEIAAVAREWGAEVPFLRPSSLATDEATTVEVVVHALDAIDDAFRCVVLLQPTSPLTGVDDVLRTLDLHRRTGSPVTTVCRVEHPVEWLFRLDSRGVLVPLLPRESVTSRRQDAEGAYRPNGAVYVATPRQIRASGFWSGETCGSLMAQERSVDIDSAVDLDVARALGGRRAVAPVAVGDRKVGSDHPCLVIAEAGVNHDGYLDRALRLVDGAAEAGADAVKFQTFRAEEVISPEARMARYQRENTGLQESQLDMVRRLALTPEETRKLARHACERGILFLSSPFDRSSVELLDDLGVPAYKIGSGEITNHPLLDFVARRGRPVLLSTGMSDLREVAAAVDIVRGRNAPLVLLHCVSSYPAPVEESNLRAIDVLADCFSCPVGWSDHIRGIHVAVAAVARGAALVEKHLTLDRSASGPDHRASIEVPEFAELVRQIREIESCLGSGEKVPAPSEQDVAEVARRSLFAVRELRAGHALRSDDLRALRPGTGLSPGIIPTLVGRTLARDVPAGRMLTEEDLLA